MKIKNELREKQNDMNKMNLLLLFYDWCPSRQ